MDTLRILVVDDESGMRLGVSRVLANFQVHLDDVNVQVGFDVDQAASGEEALDKVRIRPPDILLLDYKLPGISGLEVLEAVSADPKNSDMLTVMITAYATLETAVTATKRGAYDFLAKPFTPDELRNTVRKAAGRQMLARQARQLAQEKRQVRFQFISMLAHELKAPLGAIEGYLSILRDRSAGDDPAIYERIVSRSIVRAEHMRKLITDLLDMTRIESGQLQRELTTVNVREAAQSAIDTVTPQAAVRGVAILLHAPAEAPFRGDRGELEMMLNNLISNAVKYNRQDGRVDVTLTVEAGTLTIVVADTGIGMTPEEQAGLFGDFFRAKNEDTREILGSGLGLSIVRKLAQLYDGQVQVVSQRGVGSTFTVVLRQ